MKSATKDPLLAAMEGDVSALDPSKQWTAAQTSQFYNAFNSQGAYHGQQITGQGGGVEALGANPYGLWGNAANIASGADAKTNETSAGNTPDIQRFAGSRPTQSFLSKYGADIGALALTAVTAGAAAPLAGAVLGGTTALDVGLAGAAIGTAGTAALDAGFGKPITLGSLAGGALGGVGASGALTGLGNAVGGATGLGNAGGGALVGAGVGAAGSALNHGNIALGALGGAASGAIRGSGVAGQAGSAINSSTGIPTGLATAGVNAGLGYGTRAVLGGLAGGTPQNGTNYIGAGALGGVYSGTYYGGGANSGGGGGGGSGGQGLAGTITGALPGLLQAGAGTAGSLAASNALVNADQNAITTQQNNLGNINGIWSAQQQLGQGADTALGSALGTNGQPANYSGFENMPGYQFAIQQGTQAIQRQAASMGSAYTPNTATAVGQYVTGTAMQDYNTYISQLMGAAGLGTTANQGLQTANQSTANNISTLQQNIGQAQAGGYSGVASAAGGLFSPNGAGTSLIGAAGNYLFGNGSNGGNGSSGVAGSPTLTDGGSATNYDNSGVYGDGTGSTTDINNITGGVDPNAFGNF
jgi:hypothetical protein